MPDLRPVAESPPPPPNRLSIGLMLVWLSLTAIEFAAHGRDLVYQRELLESIGNALDAELLARIEFLWRVAGIVNWCSLPFAALGLVGLLLWPWRAWSAPGAFPSQPGHWLLVSVGVYALGDLIVWTWVTTVDPGEWLAGARMYFIYSIATALMLLASAIVLLVALRKRLRGRLWTVSLALLAGGLAVRSLSEGLSATNAFWLPAPRFVLLLQWLPLLGSGAMLLALPVAGAQWIQDVRRAVPRDLFHLLGLVAVTMLLANRLVGWLLNQFLF